MALIFACPCFNLEIIVNAGRVRQSQDNEINGLAGKDAFFQNVQVLEATTGFVVNKKLECLCLNRRVEDWVISRCINCSKETHAVSISPQTANICYLSVTMTTNPSTSLLPLMKDYSSVYNIVIQPQQHLEQTDSLPDYLSGKHLLEINRKVANYLDKERELMAERIRIYENEQKQEFNFLESKAWQDHHALAEIVNFQQESSKSVGNNRDKSAGDANISKASVFGSKVATVQPTDKHFPVKRSTFKPQHSTEESMFQMDEDEENYPDEERVFESSDDDRGGDDDDATEVNPSDSYKMFATSMPIAMPGQWKKARQLRNNVDSDEDDLDNISKKREGPGPDGIAASIKALAMSVRGDGTEMFGARPRPRLNTLD